MTRVTCAGTGGVVAAAARHPDRDVRGTPHAGSCLFAGEPQARRHQGSCECQPQGVSHRPAADRVLSRAGNGASPRPLSCPHSHARVPQPTVRCVAQAAPLRVKVRQRDGHVASYSRAMLQRCARRGGTTPLDSKRRRESGGCSEPARSQAPRRASKRARASPLSPPSGEDGLSGTRMPIGVTAELRDFISSHPDHTLARCVRTAPPPTPEPHTRAGRNAPHSSLLATRTPLRPWRPILRGC